MTLSDSDSGLELQTQWLHCTKQKFLHCTESDSDSNPNCQLQNGIGIQVRIRNVNEPLKSWKLSQPLTITVVLRVTSRSRVAIVRCKQTCSSQVWLVDSRRSSRSRRMRRRWRRWRRRRVTTRKKRRRRHWSTCVLCVRWVLPQGRAEARVYCV